MWRRVRRRSFAPRRPALYSDQLGLALLTAAVIVGSIVVVFLALHG